MHTSAPKRRPALIVVGVLLLLGSCAAAFSATVWWESATYAEKRAEQARQELDAYRGTSLAYTEKLLDEQHQHGRHRHEAEWNAYYLGGGAGGGLLLGAVFLALGARKR